MLKVREEYKEAAGVYFRVSGEVVPLSFTKFSCVHGFEIPYVYQLPQEPLVSAVMLEQASYCYLSSVPPMLRKYGFHLILSGDSYKKCDQVCLMQNDKC